MSKERKILFFTPTSYESLKRKDVLWMIGDREENGYFDKVFTIHPFIPPGQLIKISDKSTLIEYWTARYDIFKKLGLNFIRQALMLFSLMRSTVQLIKRENISIIRSTIPYTAGLIALVCARITRIPFCVSIHSDYDLAYKNTGTGVRYFGSHRLAKIIEKFVLSHADMVMPIRESLAKYAVNNGARPESIRIIPHGIDLKPFLETPDSQLKQELGITGMKVVSFIGRLSKDNYAGDIIKIASEVCARNTDAVFLIVGDGEERARMGKMSTGLQIQNRVVFLGFQPHERVAGIRLISDVSLCLMGGFSLIEAAAAGTPLIAYDVDWHYELVKNGQTGYLLQEGDIDGAAMAISKLLDNPDLARKMGDEARRLAVERHSRENANRIIIKYYEELIHGQRSGRKNS